MPEERKGHLPGNAVIVNNGGRLNQVAGITGRTDKNCDG